MSANRGRIVLLISGRGSNMEAFIRAVGDGTLDADIAGVIANRPDAPGIQTAAGHGLHTAIVDHKQFSSREAFDIELARTVQALEPDLVVLAGFMRILTPLFVDQFAGRLLNIHPSLLPKYPGLNTHQRAIDSGDTEAGATVHYVTTELDGGPAILQARVPIEFGDSADSLAQRILPLEHRIYPAAAQLHLSGELRLIHGRCVLGEQVLPTEGLSWPIENATTAALLELPGLP